MKMNSIVPFGGDLVIVNHDSENTFGALKKVSFKWVSLSLAGITYTLQ